MAKRANLTASLVLLPSCIRAAWELALARLHLNSLTPRSILALNASFEPTRISLTDAKATSLCKRAAYVIPRVAARLPWRADCLVQALAAQRWLRDLGVDTQISIGVDRDEDGGLLAHAWLKHRDIVVTGGMIDRFSTLLASSSQSSSVDC